MTVGKVAFLSPHGMGDLESSPVPGDGKVSKQSYCTAGNRKETVNAAGRAVPADWRAMDGQPRIAFVRWLAAYPGRKPSDFEPLIKEAEFAFRCRAAAAPVGNDLGGPITMERQLRNLELGVCCGWRVMTPVEARSLAAWLDAALLHHPWREAIAWHNRKAREALIRYGQAGECAPITDEERYVISAAGLEDVLNHACAVKTWQDAQNLVFAAWFGGKSLVDERGHLIAKWKMVLAETLASRIERHV